ncbi:MAG: GNAT family N-acetyltransferase [Gammaproteobacteria bacterium]|nr:GNAT family N-acetyltransferase [Gammaproteobacteria bacterium]
MQFEFITTNEQFLELETDWKKLNSESASPFQFFQNWYWVYSWWENFASQGDYKLKILVCTDNSSVILIWPWVINNKHGLKILEPMGGLLSCFDDVVMVKTNDNNDLLQRAWKYILEKSEEDAIELKSVHTHATIASLMTEIGGTPISTTSSPEIDMRSYDDFEDYISGRTKKMRQNQRRSLKYICEKGALKGDGDDPALPVDLAIDTCLTFKSQWLSARGLSGKSLVTDQAKVFLKQVCNYYKQNPSAAKLCISSLHLDDKPISLGVGFRYHNYHFEYLGGFDYQLERFGPGRLRMEFGMRDCFDKGISAYNMLTPATAFKKIWTENNPVVEHYIIPTSIRGRAYRDVYMRTLRPRLKKIYNSMPSSFRTKLVPNNVWG